MKCPTCNREIQDIIEKNNPFAHKIICDNCSSYYIENGFLARLRNFENIYGEDKTNLVRQSMLKFISENKKVVFVADYEAPATIIEDAVYIEFVDVTNRAKLFYTDINSNDYND